MTLNKKIFITFFISVTALLSTTLYLIDTQAEQHEIQRIIADLSKTQAQFQHDLKTKQQHIQRLSHIITSNQKFRSFLSQIKDNFYPFTAEIGKDTGADFVFMLDDQPKIRAIYSSNNAQKNPLEINFSAFEIEKRLDFITMNSEMISLDKALYSSHFIPLKEGLNDDYAIGLILISNQINDAWVTQLLTASSTFQAVFFNNHQVVAKNTHTELANTMLENHQMIIDEGFFYWHQQRYIAKHVLFNNKTNAGYILSANLDQALAEFKQLQQQIALIGGSILLFGAVLFMLISQRITRPLRLITDGTQAINRGDYQYRISYQSTDEVGQLATAFNLMAAGLEERERIRNTFSQYIDPVIVTELLSQPDKLKLGGERKQQSVLFSDIANFTHFSEKLPAEELVNVLNEYLSAMTAEIAQQQGILDKFIGDAIMAFWSPQLCDNQHAQHACHTALNMQTALNQLRPLWISQGKPEINIRIGIATGEMIVGNIGSEQARSYTCIGDKVNYSSRLEGLNKYYGTHVIIDQQTVSQITDLIVRELDTVKVKGREEGEIIYELVGKQGQVNVSMLDKIKRYQHALMLYRKAEFLEAAAVFSALDNDIPSQIMSQRCQELQQNPPKNWKGVHSMLNK